VGHVTGAAFMKISNRVLHDWLQLITGLTLCFAAVLVLGISSRAHAAGDATRGADVFDGQCAECHSVKPGKNKKGPSLFGIAERKAGSIADFSYSEAMKNCGITWNVDKLDDYVTHPKKTVPGDKMKFDGLENAKERADLIQFLITQH
jgi:cytochrome c